MEENTESEVGFVRWNYGVRELGSCGDGVAGSEVERAAAVVPDSAIVRESDASCATHTATVTTQASQPMMGEAKNMLGKKRSATNQTRIIAKPKSPEYRRGVARHGISYRHSASISRANGKATMRSIK